MAAKKSKTEAKPPNEASSKNKSKNDAAGDDQNTSTGKKKLKPANSINVRHILVRPPLLRPPFPSANSRTNGRTDETRPELTRARRQCEKHSQMEAVLQRLGAGERFDDVAREASADKARQGGSLGWKPRGSLLREFEDVAYALEVSSVGAPRCGRVRTGEGWHVLMVEGRR